VPVKLSGRIYTSREIEGLYTKQRSAWPDSKPDDYIFARSAGHAHGRVCHRMSHEAGPGPEISLPDFDACVSTPCVLIPNLRVILYLEQAISEAPRALTTSAAASAMQLVVLAALAPALQAVVRGRYCVTPAQSKSTGRCVYDGNLCDMSRE
jgi:hypothetical protein